MLCYVCQKLGKRSEAVATCVVCGIALCPEHLVREELPIWKDVQSGLGVTLRQLPERLPRVVCADCHAALGQP